MAVETTYSPRISFSYNVCQQDSQASFESRVQESIPLDSSVEFEFSLCESSDIEHSSADDLFYNGKILAIGPARRTRNFPSQLRIEPTTPPSSSPAPQARAATGPALARLVETMEEPDEKQLNRHTFWQFVRSRSSSAASSSKSPSLCFFPLMPRSQSTGSKSLPPKTSNLSEKNNYCRKPSPLSPPNKKSFGSRNGQSNGRSAPALNVPLADIFGLASLCLNRKCKTKA